MSEDEQNYLLSAVDQVAPEGWRKRLAEFLIQIGIGTDRGRKIYLSGRDAVDVAEGRSIISRAYANKIASDLIADTQQVERAKDRFLGALPNKQANLEAVLKGAEQRLLTFEASAESSVEHDGPAASSEVDADVDAEIDSDWVLSFTREAEVATSLSLRDRLSRVLAGELKKPGSFPRGVFRSIVELEKNDLDLVKNLLEYRIDRVVSLDTFDSAAWDDVDTQLADCGLIEPRVAGAEIFNLKYDGSEYFTAIRAFGNLGLLVQSRVSSFSWRRGKHVLLTRAGAATFDILDDRTDESKVRQLAELLGQTSTRLTLCTVKPDGNRHYRYVPLEVIRDELV